MNRVTSLFIITTMSLVTLLSCQKEESGPDPAEAAKSFVYALHDGNYAKAANLTLMIDSAPKNYKDLIAARYKEIASDHKAQYGEITEVTCKKADISDDKNEADVYLTIKYSNKTTTNILLQLCMDKDQWKIR